MSSKSDDAKLAKLVRKNAAKAASKKAKAPKRYDDTLVSETTDDDLERRDFFSEMKKREF
jgi:ribosomal protein L17